MFKFFAMVAYRAADYARYSRRVAWWLLDGVALFLFYWTVAPETLDQISNAIRKHYQ